MNNTCDLSRQMEEVLAENIRLKQENAELKEHIKIQKNWTGIREGYLLPKLRERYGSEGRNLQTNVIASIGNVVKEFLGIHRFSEITESNYDMAKEIAIALTETFCKFDWSYLKKMQEYYRIKGIK